MKDNKKKYENKELCLFDSLFKFIQPPYFHIFQKKEEKKTTEKKE